MLIIQDSYLLATSLVVEQMLHLATLLVVYSTLASVSCTLLSPLAAASSSLCNILLHADGGGDGASRKAAAALTEIWGVEREWGGAWH
jgi:hypothetical protein